MYLTHADVNELNEERLTAFIEQKIPEGFYLDYKRQLSGNNNDTRYREFLKDVTAFANAGGGHLIIGAQEPVEGRTAQEQLVGIEYGEALAVSLEQVCNSAIDPRIPGLLIRAIPLDSGRHALIAHIPPSLSRPHMVTHGKTNSFYIRHTESSVPMSTHEIRESVIASMSAEARVVEYMEKQESDIINFEMATRGSVFVLQAMPLISLETDWDVFGESVENVVYHGVPIAGGRNELGSSFTPEPTMYGVTGGNIRDAPTKKTHVHRNGYIRASFLLLEKEVSDNGDKYRFLNPYFCTFITAFGEFCSKLLDVTQSDRPYLMRMRCFNARGVVFVRSDEYSFSFVSPGYPKDVIEWPDTVRQTSESFSRVTEHMCEMMHNAFGLRR